MYCFGEDFDFDVNVVDLFTDYIEKMERKKKQWETTPILECEWEKNIPAYQDNKQYLCQEAKNGWLPYESKNEFDTDFIEDEQEFKKMLSPITAAITPFVEETVEKTAYAGSPIYHKKIEKEIVEQMVEDTYNTITNKMDFVNLERPQTMWGQGELLRELVEYMILCEIVTKKRLKKNLL